MAITVNTNVSSLTAQRNLQGSGKMLSTSLQRLSSGLRINSAKDDAAGLAISDRMNSQVRGLNQAVRNANDGISLMQTGEGALQEATSMLQRIRELAVQSANDTNTAADRAQLQKEVTSLTSELDRIAQTTAFNGKTLFDGTFGTATFQVGAEANQTISAATSNFRTSVYGNQTIAGTASAGATASRASSSDIVVNGSQDSGTYAVTTADTAKTIAEGVNNLETGVTASARTELDITLSAAGAYTVNVTSDNSTAKSISFTIGGATGSDNLAEAAKAFNDVAGETGVTAEVNDAATGITLVNATGNDITLEDDTNIANAGTVTAGTAVLTAASGDTVTGVINGQVTLDSDKSFSATDAGSGFAVAGSSTLQAVNTMDVSSVSDATTAIKVADAAIAAIDNQRADFGALQNRFESTISNLMNVSENISAAKSRIVDADFAAETASMTKAQILQQAGLAMLSQANQVPQAALSLLQG